MPQSDRPDKNRYSLTPAGRAELHEWATSARGRTGGYRDELFLKLFGAASLGPEALAALVEAQRGTYLSEIGGLTRLRHTHTGDPLVSLLIDAAIAHTKADLELVESAPARLASLTAAAAPAACTDAPSDVPAVTTDPPSDVPAAPPHRQSG